MFKPCLTSTYFLVCVTGVGCCSISALVYIFMSYLTLKTPFLCDLTLNCKTSPPQRGRPFSTKWRAILNLLKPRGTGLKFLSLRPEMLLVCLDFALYQIWHLYPPGEYIPPFYRLTHCTRYTLTSMVVQMLA